MQQDTAQSSTAALSQVSLKQAFWVWLKIALTSFGGPASQIAMMHRILVEEKRWISESRFLHALNYCMLLPGPEAQQLATYIGWLMHKTRGGILAGLLFILPGFLSILALSFIYIGHTQNITVQALFYGLKPAVMAIVMSAVFKIASRVLKNTVMLAIAAAAFIAIFFLNIPFPIIVLTSAALGYLGQYYWRDMFNIIAAHKLDADSKPQLEIRYASDKIKPSWRRSVTILLFGLLIWFSPLVLLFAFPAGNEVFIEIHQFFSKTAIITFGGAYSVLAYVAQHTVDVLGWLKPSEMLDGLGLAESTPGPLIQVLQFVGFIGAYRNPGTLDPMTAAFLGSLLATWATFIPCFLWIFIGAPYIEYLRENTKLNCALSAVTACVVGVILSLSIWFSMHTVFASVEETKWGFVRLLSPDWSSIDPVSLVLSICAFIALQGYKQGMLRVLFSCTSAGLLYFLFTH